MCYRELAEPNAAKAACGAIEPSTQSVELSQTTVCEIFALAKTDRPAGRFNRRQQSTRISPTGEMPAGDRRQQSTRFSAAGEKPAGDRCQQASSYAATAAFNR